MDVSSLVREAFAPEAGRRLLDVGCGAGGLARVLAGRGARVTGIDPNPQAVAAAAAAVPEARFEAARAEALPFPDAAFDGAVCLNALHHTADPGAALAEMARVVAPGGRIVVVEPLAEGSYFAALRPIEDETAVRAAAQEALARAVDSGVLRCLRDVTFVRTERFPDLDAFVARAVAVDPARRAAAEARRAEVAEAFAGAASGQPGDHVLVQPLRAQVLVAGER
ncbi:class I SAM-dependent methyltransferase [Methylobacterium sp. A54F]